MAFEQNRQKTRHITAANVPDSVKSELQAQALENVATQWEHTREAWLSEEIAEVLREEATKLREATE